MSTALVLSGGGARAAYQVGVLQAVSEFLDDKSHNPFSIICGSSAGAINASVIASKADHFAESIERLDALWRGLESDDVHHLGIRAIASSLFGLVRAMFNEGYGKDEPWSLLDNQPLENLLGRLIHFDRISEMIKIGEIHALSIAALGYTSGNSLSFFESHQGIAGWKSHRRIGLPVKLNINHLMASTAIPGVYPPVKIHREYFGDGAIRQTAPLSTALHLGATKLFVIGVSHNPGQLEEPRRLTNHTPSLAQMTSNLLNGSFIDSLEDDMEGLLKINSLLALLPDEQLESVPLRLVDVLAITPSKRFDDVAAAHVESLPASMRFLFKTLGATRSGGGTSLASYLLFESPFLSELIDCGYTDAMVRHEEIKAFLNS